MDGIAIEEFEPQTAGEATLAAYVDLRHAVDVHDLAPDPPHAGADVLAMLLHPAAFEVDRHWLAWDSAHEHLLGAFSAGYEETPDNRTHLWLSGHVHPAYRRRRIGTCLSQAAVPWARELGRTTWCWELRDGDGPGFVTAVGGARKLRSRQSGLRIVGLDRDLVQSWIGQAPERVGDYSLVKWAGAAPEAFLDDFARIWNVMNSQPFEDFDHEDFDMTPALVREYEASTEAKGWQRYTICARHDPSGRLAGLTEITASPHEPWRVWQGDTGTDPEHRGRGLGRWMKAAMLEHLLATRPGLERIDTWNAGSNEAMLGINVALGFEVIHWWGDWQADLDVVEARLAALGASAPAADAADPHSASLNSAGVDTAVAGTAVADNAIADGPVADNAVADTAVADEPVADTTVADKPVADTAVSDKPVAGAAVAGTAVAGTAVADNAVPDNAVPDNAVATAVADTAVADTAEAGTGVADTAVAVNSVADTAVADNSVADCAGPNSVAGVGAARDGGSRA